MNPRKFPTLPAIGALTLIYIVAGKLALLLAFLNKSASPVWPPAGLALAALLVPTPTKSIIATIRRILIDHNTLEEGPDGVYEQCEQLASLEAENLLLRLRNAPAVKMSAHVDNLTAMDSLRIALHRAGYTLEA